MTLIKPNKLFILFSMLSIAAICGEYAMTRPASNALFLTVFSSKAYPLVWLMTVPVNLLSIYLYNCFLPKIGPLKMLWIFAFFSIFVNVTTGFYYSTFPKLIFLQHIWKDIYVLLMLKQTWSMIHSTIPVSGVKLLYGCIYGMGTIGAISGSLVPSFLATSFGSEKILMLTFPVYLFLIFSYTLAYFKSEVSVVSFERKFPKNFQSKEIFSLIRRSKVLIAVLLLVILMQVSVGLMEYRFNAHLECNIFEKDLRTAYCGRIGGIINLLSLFFQFIGSVLLVKTIGLRKSHFLVPIFLGVFAIYSLLYPTFVAISLFYILIKAVDFSLFGVIREMLYVPLQLDAKYQAKAIIDVFAYRTSKAVVSLSLFALQLVFGSYLLKITGYFSLAIFIGWLVTVFVLFRDQREFAEVM